MAEEFDLNDYDAPIDITAEYVLDQVDDLLIYRHYLGAFKLGTTIKSPFRRDSSPSFSITINPNWLKLMWKDFGTGEVGDCFKLVAKLNKITYREAVEKVACDFGLVKGCSIVTKKQILEAQAFKEEFQKKEYLIQVERRKMNEEELAYWSAYSITKEELTANHIYAINKLWVNKKAMNLDVSHLHFAYYFPIVDKWKIYSPTDKDHKWFGNVSSFQMEGEAGKDFEEDKPMIVTKSRKDRIILKKLYTNVCSCQNEAEGAIPRGMDVYFDTFPAKYCWFDSDEPGKTANRKLNHRGYKWINVPNELYEKHGLKDPSDTIKHFGWDEGSKILINELKKKNIC
jgi:hypothetical protein